MAPTHLRYVILRHEDIDAPHFDLMFETTPVGRLATWRSDVWPIDRPTPLLRLGDHRREYLTYEGPLTGNRGSVRRIEAGTVVSSVSSPEESTLELSNQRNTTVIQLRVDCLRGEPYWTGTRLNPPSRR